MPLSETLPQVFIIIPQADGNCPFLLEQHFLKIFFPEEKERGGEDYVVGNISKVNKGISHKI